MVHVSGDNTQGGINWNDSPELKPSRPPIPGKSNPPQTTFSALLDHAETQQFADLSSAQSAPPASNAPLPLYAGPDGYAQAGEVPSTSQTSADGVDKAVDAADKQLASALAVKQLALAQDGPSTDWNVAHASLRDAKQTVTDAFAAEITSKVGANAKPSQFAAAGDAIAARYPKNSVVRPLVDAGVKRAVSMLDTNKAVADLVSAQDSLKSMLVPPSHRDPEAAEENVQHAMQSLTAVAGANRADVDKAVAGLVSAQRALVKISTPATPDDIKAATRQVDDAARRAVASVAHEITANADHMDPHTKGPDTPQERRVYNQRQNDSAAEAILDRFEKGYDLSSMETVGGVVHQALETLDKNDQR